MPLSKIESGTAVVQGFLEFLEELRLQFFDGNPQQGFLDLVDPQFVAVPAGPGQQRVEVEDVPLRGVHGDPEQDEPGAGSQLGKKMPGPVELDVEKLSEEVGLPEDVVPHELLLELLGDVGEFERLFQVLQLLGFIVAEDFLLGEALVDALLPVVEEVEQVEELHHFPDGLVLYAADGTDAQIVELVPVHVAIHGDVNGGIVQAV